MEVQILSWAFSLYSEPLLMLGGLEAAIVADKPPYYYGRLKNLLPLADKLPLKLGKDKHDIAEQFRFLLSSLP